MKVTKFTDEMVEIISGKGILLSSSDAYVGDKVYKISYYKKGEKGGAAYAVVSENDTLACLKDIRNDIDKFTAEKAFDDLEKRIRDLVDNDKLAISLVAEKEEAPVEANEETEEAEEAEAVAEANEDAEEEKVLAYPLIVKLSPIDMVDDLLKSLSGEINDWLDSLMILKSNKKEKDEKDILKKEYAMIMESSYMPHDNESEVKKDYSNVMAGLAVVFTLLSLVTLNNYEYTVIPVVGMIAGLFAAMRCYAVKNNRAFLVSIVCVVCCAAFFGIDFTSMKQYYSNVKLK